MHKKNREISLYKILGSVLPVMLGVYLGLLVNNWNETDKEKKLSNQILKSIGSELIINKNEIKNSINYYTQLRDTADYYISKKEVFKSFSFWKGLNPPLLRNSAYQTGMNTGAIFNIDLQLLEQLSNVYNLQTDLKEQSQMYVQSVTDKIGTTDFDNRKYLEILFNFSYDQVVSEKYLLKELEKASMLLKQNLKIH